MESLINLDDFTEEQYGPLSKRSRSSLFPSSSSLNQWSSKNNESLGLSSQHNLLDEGSLLGLRLRKSPSLLDLIQMAVSKKKLVPLATSSCKDKAVNAGSKKEPKGSAASVANDRLKASNFRASLLRIGAWEYVTRYEGDLVAKCYFAKRKLVWEVLDGGLKSKLEIQWSDITGLQAIFPDDGPSTLTLVLGRPPVFFRETNPQPRKHTSWEATTDFTNGQASMHRQHVLQCPLGVLNKHYENLIQFDERLNTLSKQPEIVMEPSIFESRDSAPYNSEESVGHGIAVSSPYSGASEAALQALSINSGLTTFNLTADSRSPCSVMDTNAIEGNRTTGQADFQGQDEDLEDLEGIYGNIAHELLSDNQRATVADEISLMKKVHSLCCLLQDPVDETPSKMAGNSIPTHQEDVKDATSSKAVCREDSHQDLLFRIPHVCSMPKSLCDIAEVDESPARQGFIWLS